MVRGFIAFTAICATVAGLSLVDPDTARWLAIGAVVAMAYIASALPRRKDRPSRVRREAHVRGEASER